MITIPQEFPQTREQLTEELRAIIQKLDKYEFNSKTKDVPIFTYCGGVTYLPSQMVLNCLDGNVSNDLYPCEIQALRSLIVKHIRDDLFRLECIGWVDENGELCPQTFGEEVLSSGCSFIPASWVAYAMKFIID